MQGRTPYQAELFSTVIIEDLIPANHILRKIDKAVSFSFVRDLTSELYSKETGRPSIDPEVFVRMLVVQYLFGIRSDRQLCEELQYNLAYRWFCQINLSEKVPHHSSMTRIRDRFGEEIFLKIFLEVLKICKMKGLISGHEVMVDASLMKANAALDSLVAKGATKEQIKNRPIFIRGKGYKNETYESFSDPDATLAGKTGVPKGLYYKVHNVVEPSHRIILDSHVTTGSSVDGRPFIERILETQRQAGFNIHEVTADRAYGSGDHLSFFQDVGVKTNIPLFHSNSNDHLKGFIYDNKNDRFKCKAGEYLYPFDSIVSGNKKYAIRNKACKNCALKSTCLAKFRYEWKGIINANIHYEVMEKVKKKEKTKSFKKKLRERMWKVEGLFGEAKERHLLRRAKYRGISKVQIQAHIIALVQNLKRIAISTLKSFILHVRRKIIFSWKMDFRISKLNFIFYWP